MEPKEGSRQLGERQLLERVLESSHFAHASSLKRILQYLCNNSWEKDGPTLIKEYELATCALGRPQSFDPKIDPVVRVSIASIRQRLEAYFETDGKNETLCLEVPKGAYRAAFSSRPSGTSTPEEALGQPLALSRFWRPYLSGSARNMLVYTDVLFFRDDAGTYLRNIHVNDVPGGLEKIKRYLHEGQFNSLKPSFHFVSSGEVHATLSLIQLFARLKAPLLIRNSRFTSWNELRTANLILLGSSRTNSFVDSLQGNGNFVITADEIRNLEPREGEGSIYVGHRYMDGKLEKVVEPAVVTRRPGLTSGTVVTMISANHGRAIEGAGNFLTLEHGLTRALKSGGLGGANDLPPHFQLVLQVDMVDFDEEVVNVELITSRVIRSSTRTAEGPTASEITTC
jgi:hypothetical protein